MTDQFESSSTAGLLPAGRQLRNAREALELSPEQVANQLKLAVRQVIAIEQEAFDELPSNLFIRGFVRNYARLVHLDAEPLLEYLAQVLPAEQVSTTLLDAPLETTGTIPFKSKRRRPSSAIVLMSVLGLALGVGCVFWYLQQPAHPELALPEMENQPIVDVIAASAVQEELVVLASAASAVAPVASSPQLAATLPVASAPQTKKAAAVLASTASAVADTHAIKITSQTDSWVQIVDANGNKVLSEIIRPGYERVVAGVPPYRVKIGNAPKTQLYFNGQNVDLSAYLKPGSDVVNMELK
ncbi:RodZ domain-containing protein [uncultured Deefgea sp.]|uniref:RodZ domain-containing protein n=1 Tax=uncultured Deefgea sp. TaxID=1304914 RepID=UPI0026029ADA|nr:RodZ domain-containing protein [uncultured Deefgea sp.]